MRERLIKKINTIEFDYGEILAEYAELEYRSPPDYAEYVADRLLAEGIIVPPCKIGDTVYYHGFFGSIGEGVVTEIHLSTDSDDSYIYLGNESNGFAVSFSDIYPTREEAEKALKALKGGEQK